MKGARDGDASVNGRVPYPGERLTQLLAEPDTGCFDLGALQELYGWLFTWLPISQSTSLWEFERVIWMGAWQRRCSGINKLGMGWVQRCPGELLHLDTVLTIHVGWTLGLKKHATSMVQGSFFKGMTPL